MATTSATPGAAESVASTTIKVFISYSRADRAFADDLVLGLAACGFAPYIDREDIAAGEDWEERLSGLIAEADTVVFVISPDSLVSDQCRWELTKTQLLAKRVLPVVWRPVEDAAPPTELRRLNYIFFSGEGRSFAAGLAQLAEALRVDIDWIREHTRLGQLAARWSARGRSDALLLRGDELDAAQAWMRGRAPGAPEITDAQSDFIKAAADARSEAERRAARAKAGLLTAVSLAAVIFAGLAGAAAWQWRAADAAQKTTAATLADLETATTEIRSANLRLNAEIGLRTAPADDGYFVIDAGWYPVAANFSGAVALVERAGGGRLPTLGSGFVIDGALVHPRYAGEALLLSPSGGDPDLSASAMPAAAIVAASGDPSPATEPTTPADTLPADAPMTPQRTATSGDIGLGEETVQIRFPTLDPDRPITAAEMVWSTPDWMGGVHPHQIWRLASAAPFGARMLTREDVDCQGFDATPENRTVGSFGVDFPTDSKPGVSAVTLNISVLLDRTDPYGMTYTHATNRVSNGSPVFDLATGDVIAIHIGSAPDPGRPGRRRGYGTSLELILDMARQDMADQDAQLGPVCEG